MEPQVPSWAPDACAWEWGGVVEAVPRPCSDPTLSRVAGAALVPAGAGLLLLVFCAAVLLALLVQTRKAL